MTTAARTAREADARESALRGAHTSGRHGATTLRRVRRYSAYRKSGVEWLGEIPAHWDLRRLKTLASIELSNVDKKSIDGQASVRLCNYTHVYNNERITSDLDFMPATATLDQVRRFSLRAGDVLITKDSESWTDIAVPAFVQSDLPGVLCGYHLALVRPGDPEGLGAFLARAFSAIGVRDQLQMAATGVTRFGLSGDAIETALFAIPPSDERRAIAAFLDRETGKIDALIAKKERLIASLAERRTGVISRAVTKGIDPTAHMRSSGVSWLGDIPAHWEIVRSNRLFAQRNTKALLSDEQLTASQQYGVIPLARFLELERRRVVQVLTGADILRHVEPNDFVISMRSFQGGIESSKWKGAVSSAYVVLVPSQSVNHSFFTYLLKATPYIQALQSTSNLVRDGQALRFENFALVDLPLVPFNEQAAIAEYLDDQTARLDSLADSVREAILRLMELRTSLIAAAVTGKIDVRRETIA